MYWSLKEQYLLALKLKITRRETDVILHFFVPSHRKRMYVYFSYPNICLHFEDSLELLSFVNN